MAMEVDGAWKGEECGIVSSTRTNAMQNWLASTVRNFTMYDLELRVTLRCGDSTIVWYDTDAFTSTEQVDVHFVYAQCVHIIVDIC